MDLVLVTTNAAAAVRVYATSIIASDMMQRSNGVPDVRHARKSREKKSRDSVEVVVRRGSGSIGPSCHCSIRSGVP